VIDRLDDLQKDVMDNTIRRLNYNAGARSFLRIGFMAGYAAAFLWGVFGIKSGAVTFGMMTAFLQLVGQVQRPIADISRHIPAFIHSLTSVERILELTDLPLEAAGEDIVFTDAPGIRLEDVSFAYTDVPEGVASQLVLEHFSYDFKPSSVTAVMGVTGAGKSTLTRLILALLHPSRGSIVLYSGDRSVPVSPATRCNFRYVPQGNSLMSGTVRDNLLLANPSASEEEMKEALHLAVADFVFDLRDGLETVCSEKGSGLSEGQAQRIAIARALLHPGGVLILDEATSALDRDTEDELLRRLSQKISGGKTILWITHRESVTSIADAVLRI
jgi:ABC-type multidrug transport system fused ATPase/permease subunit